MSPIPGSLVPCRKCGTLVRVPGADGSSHSHEVGVPAAKLTGSKRSRGFYCERCIVLLTPGHQAVRK